MVKYNIFSRCWKYAAGLTTVIYAAFSLSSCASGHGGIKGHETPTLVDLNTIGEADDNLRTGAGMTEIHTTEDSIASSWSLFGGHGDISRYVMREVILIDINGDGIPDRALIYPSREDIKVGRSGPVINVNPHDYHSGWSRRKTRNRPYHHHTHR